MPDRNTAMINFRLNLLKNDDREIYDYIQQFESSEFKAVLKGGKSTFIKTVLLSYIRETKQEQKAAKTLAEQKAQNEKLAEMLGAKLEESQKALIQTLPELVEKVRPFPHLAKPISKTFRKDEITMVQIKRNWFKIIILSYERGFDYGRWKEKIQV